jgi:hypothetical protein
MGMFQIKVKVANPADPKKFFEENFWVDTAPCIPLFRKADYVQSAWNPSERGI